ncbi:hypothetical protein [Promicromonospora kroppenstedtii]|uniref:hypothetical protein n=1 Tax=Promicromonospora kroppenstedtii TaxID=440482 RepID=UPI0004B93A62|nr:hypothetical protein [Promicromonospora kroppenstedtii]
MSDLTFRSGEAVQVERDFLPWPGEDVRVAFFVPDADDLDLFLSPDEADNFAALLTEKAAEVRQINKEANRA